MEFQKIYGIFDIKSVNSEMKNNSARLTIFVLTVFIALSSCVPNKKLSYLQSDKDEIKTDKDLYFIGTPQDNKIRPGDELYINVSSADEEPTSFNSDREPTYDASLLSYAVDEQGFIKLPYIGKIKLSELSLEQASDSIESNLSQFLFYPSVFIKFINNKVTLLGEVNSPGVYAFNYKNINILQAIGYAGDITDFGNRAKVLLIRDDGNVKTKYYIDLTSDDILSSEWYLLKTNDIIYVEPLKRKKWGMREVPYNLILSFISTAVVIITFVNTTN